MGTNGEGLAADGRHLRSKRRRVLISCTECHRRKQKCNRCRPCQNCVKRGKLDLCRYEADKDRACNNTVAHTTSASSGESSLKPSDSCAGLQSSSKVDQLSLRDYGHLVGKLGYSTHNAHNTFSLINKIGATDSSESSPLEPTDVFNRKSTALDDKYRSLMRQLPPKEYIDILVQQYFSHINWQYDVLDEITFRQQLESWRRFSYSANSQENGPLPVDILAMPSLVCQLIAHSLIHQSVGGTMGLESLKYAPGMTFVDLACDFSEAGYSFVGSIERKDISVVTVQSGILRASFLKNTGSVIEAWHVVGTTIRNAQEIGLHTDITIQSPLVSVDALWNHEMRRRVWFVLHNWDIHMAVVLGRPITTITTAGTVLPPDDLAQRESGKQPRRRADQDAPTPSSIIRIGYATAYQYFPRVRELEHRGARIEDYHIVQETHTVIMGNIGLIPDWCRNDNPDLHFDKSPDCHWLPAARQSLTSGIYFVLLSLHRPYIFSVSESRKEALKAALIVFTAQRQLFHLSEPKDYLTFNMVYPLFDAMVISLAVLLLFPTENWESQSRLVDSVYWGVDIFAKIGQRNAMARSANSVVRTLLSQLKKTPVRSLLPYSSSYSEENAIQRSRSGTADPRPLTPSLIMELTNNDLDASNLIESSSLFDHQELSTVPTLPNVDVQSLWPPRPVGDLFHQDVYISAPQTLQNTEAPAEISHFDGNFSEDSFWNFMNDFSHS